MKKLSALIACATIAAVFAIFGSTHSASATELPEGWLTDWKEAKALALETGKPIFGVFSAEWCGPCQAMKRDVYPKAAVRETLEEWIPVYVDSDKDPDAHQEYEVDAVPTFILFSSQSKQEDRFMGYRESEELIEILTTHKESLAAIRSLRGQLEATPEDPELWKKLGEAQEKKNNVEEALLAYERAVKYDPKDKTGVADQYYFLEALPTTRDDLEGAEIKLAAFEGKFPESELLPKVFLFRAWINADLMNAELAGEILDEGLERFPESKYAESMTHTRANLDI